MITCFYCEKSTVGSKEKYIAFDNVSGHLKCFREFKSHVLELVEKQIGEGYNSKTIARALSVDEVFHICD